MALWLLIFCGVESSRMHYINKFSIGIRTSRKISKNRKTLKVFFVCNSGMGSPVVRNLIHNRICSQLYDGTTIKLIKVLFSF